MNNLFQLLIPLFFLVYSFCWPDTALAESNSPGFKIGAIASLTGDATKNGKNWLEGTRLAVEDLSKKGIQVKLIVEDDGTIPSRAASAFAKLANIDKADAVIGGTWDFLAETLFPLAKRHKIPFITPTNPIEVLSEAFKDNPFAFTNGLSLAAEEVEIRKFLLDHSVQAIGLVYINVPYGQIHAKLLRKLAREMKMKVVVDFEFTYEGFADNLKQAALLMKKNNVKSVFIVTNYAGIDIFHRELSRLNLQPMVLMTHALHEALELSNSPARYQKSYGIYPNIINSAFISSFKKRYNAQPRDYAGAGYDALMFLAKALQKNGSFNRTSAAFKYQGVTGVHILPSENGSLVKNSAIIIHCKNADNCYSYKNISKAAP